MGLELVILNSIVTQRYKVHSNPFHIFQRLHSSPRPPFFDYLQQNVLQVETPDLYGRGWSPEPHSRALYTH